MQNKRIIPCLDVKDGRVVKGVNFVNLADAGDPVEIAKMYSDLLADELVLLDITATYENRDTIVSVVSKAAEQISIPLAVGGGIRTIDDIDRILKAGANKISINSAAVQNPDLINEGAAKFGSACIVMAIDAKRNDSGGFDVYINGGRLNAGKDVVSWAVECEKRGAGEILLTSMDCDGVKKGYDLELTKIVSEAVQIPVIASGGAGSKEDFYDVLTEGGADAALAASLFHFKELEIRDVKEYLKSRGISVRI